MTDDHQSQDPPYLKGFFVVLPDAIPVPDGSSWTFFTNEPEPLLDGARYTPIARAGPNTLREGRNFVSIRFLQVSDNTDAQLISDHQILTRAVDRILKANSQGSVSLPGVNLDRHRTVAEMVTFVASTENLVATNDKPDPLTRCLTALLKFHRAYRVLARLTCEELTYKRLHPMVITTRRSMDSTVPVVGGLMLLDMRPNRLGALYEHIGSVDFSTVTAAYGRLLVGDPTIAYLERVVDAKHAFIELGKNHEAALDLATACEVFLDGLLGMILFERGLTDEDAAVLFSKDLVPRVKQEYSKALGGRWSLTDGPVGEWYDKVAGLRNRFVHAAYQPSDAEVSKSFDAVEGLAKHAMNCLFDRSHQYPMTAWTFLGAPGFEHRGGAPRRAQEWLNSQTEDLTQRIAEYTTWRAAISSAVRHRRTSG